MGSGPRVGGPGEAVLSAGWGPGGGGRGKGPAGGCLQPRRAADSGRSPAHSPEAHRGPVAPGPPSAPPRGLLSAYYYLKPGV